MDVFTKEKRSEIMRNIKSKDSKTEILVRKIFCDLGFKHYRLATPKLNFKPDLVFPGKKIAVFVNGCFWHGHECQGGRIPKTNTDYWDLKIKTNISRDNKNYEELKKKGWRFLVIWECELGIRKRKELIQKILSFMEMKNDQAL